MTDVSWERYLAPVASQSMGAKRPGLSRAKPARPAIGPMAVTTAPGRAQRARRPRAQRAVVADWGRSSPGYSDVAERLDVGAELVEPLREVLVAAVDDVGRPQHRGALRGQHRDEEHDRGAQRRRADDLRAGE